MKTRLVLTYIVVSLIFLQCSKNEVIPQTGTAPIKLRGSWSNGWPNLFHDGKTVTSDNFIVYSDKSSQAWREELAQLAEVAFQDLKEFLDVNDSDFNFVSTQPNRKIHILTNYDQWGIAVAYRDGIIVRSKDGPNFLTGDGGSHAIWLNVLEHELTHVIEFLLIGEPAKNQASAVWMREGFGNYGARNHRTQTVQELRDWKELMRNVPGGGNPIDIEVWGDFPQSVIDNRNTLGYYPFFELAFRYLVDEENGNGTSIIDFKAYLEDLGVGVHRSTAFETRFGMTMTEFHDNFWTLMESYLGQ